MSSQVFPRVCICQFGGNFSNSQCNIASQQTIVVKPYTSPKKSPPLLAGVPLYITNTMLKLYLSHTSVTSITQLYMLVLVGREISSKEYSGDDTQLRRTEVQGAVEKEAVKLGWGIIIGSVYCHVKKIWTSFCRGWPLPKVFKQKCHGLGLTGRDLTSLSGLWYRI